MKILNERVGFVCAWGYFQEPGGWDTCVLYNILYACWACLVESDSLQPHGLSPTGLFYPWNFPGNTGVGCHFLLQGIFLSQGSSLCPNAGGLGLIPGQQTRLYMPQLSPGVIK